MVERKSDHCKVVSQEFMAAATNLFRSLVFASAQSPLSFSSGQ